MIDTFPLMSAWITQAALESMRQTVLWCASCGTIVARSEVVKEQVAPTDRCPICKKSVY